MNIFLILPTQLFKDIKILKNYEKVYLLEDDYYLNLTFHKQKLLLHVSSLRYYYDYLKENKIKVEYLTFDKINYSKICKSNNVDMYDPIDKKMINIFKKLKVNFLNSKLFLNTNKDLLKLKKDNNKYNQTEFYKAQRIKFGILMDGDKPLFGKWSFDIENRQKFSTEYKEDSIKIYNNNYIEYGINYVKKHFPKSFGEFAKKGTFYPCTHLDAKKHLNIFIKNRLNNFGKYQDGISKTVIYGEHANISALLNIGLLNPKDVIDEILKSFNKSKNKKELIKSVEGIIRQIIGWREYMHFIYLIYGETVMTKFNKLNLNKKIPISWYKDNNGTELEIINNMITKVSKYAYLHHIERLMVMNNIMILYEFKLKDILNWFMICFIDSYDWVMISNVLMNINSLDSNIKYMTKLYIASDNYIKKMSNFNNKDDFKIINDLYWKFLKKYKNVLKSDYGLSRQLYRI
jgi:deoxyribodipyrimidine photolyase-related protein